MPVPINYRTGGEVLASYDWENLVSGIGYRRFYGCSAQLASGNEEFLTNQSSTDSKPNRQRGNSPYIFDVAFGRPAYIEGTAFVNLSTQWNSGLANTTRFIITIYHVDALGAATSLGTATSSTKSYGTYRHCIRITVTGKHFGIGESLRVHVNENVVTGSSGQQFLYMDPASRASITDSEDGTVSGTDLSIDVPFRVDI